MSAAGPFRFEHLVEVNAPGDPRIDALTRAQLWRGLLMRVEHPQAFMPWLDRAEVDWLPDGTLARALHFGPEVVRDRVSLVLGESLTCRGERAGGPFELRMDIEEPAPGHLFLRFAYAVVSAEHRSDDEFGPAIREAWRRADEDTVFRIRQLAASGGLDLT